MLTATIPSGPSVRVHADAPPTCIGTAGRSMPPPAGFDPLSATTDQLQCYGFPRRPTDARGLAVWTTAMSHALHYVDPQPGSLPGDTRPLPAPATVLGNLNSTWAGYVAFTSDQSASYPGLNWEDTSSQWTVDGPKQSDTGYFYDWNGIGGQNTANVDQAGTWACDTNPCSVSFPSQYGFWYENYPKDPSPIPIKGVSITADQTAYVSTQIQSSNSTNFFVENLTTNQYTTQPESGQTINRNSAEWVLETPGNKPFNTRYITGADAEGPYGNGNWVSGAFWTYRIYNDYMSNYANPAAAINMSTDGFDICYGATNQC